MLKTQPIPTPMQFGPPVKHPAVPTPQTTYGTMAQQPKPLRKIFGG